jgi:acetyl esterase/lipase
LGLGAGRFVVEDKIYTPLAGTAAAPHRYPWQAHARQFAALAAHGIATDLFLRVMDGLADGGHRQGEEEPGPGLKARLVTALLPLTGMKRAFSSGEALRRDVARRRRKEPALPSPGMRRRLRVTETRDGGRLVVQVEPREGGARDTILYIHGGAYVRDVQSAQWSFVERLVNRTGARVLAPLYPVAPEHTWRDAFALVGPLYERLVAGVGPERLTVLGDSAGGGMALALMQRMRDRGRPLPARLVLLAPWLDVTLSDPRQREIARRDPMLDVPGLLAAGRWYAGDLDPRDPRISPINGSLRDLPPIALFTGTRDLVHPDSRRLRDKAAREGARVEYHEYPDLFHVWPEVDIPEGNRAIAQMAAFIGAGEGAEVGGARGDERPRA